MTFRVIKHCLDREGLVVEELGHINILRVINYHQWTLSKGTDKCICMWCILCVCACVRACVCVCICIYHIMHPDIFK